MIYAMEVSSPYGENGIREFEVEAADEEDARDIARQAMCGTKETIIRITVVEEDHA